MEIQSALCKVIERKDLTEEEMISVMNNIMEDGSDVSLVGAFLTALHMKGECINEIVGAAKVLREKS